MSNSTERAREILEIAETLVRRRGYNGFSHTEIASELGVSKLSIHYHFKTKEELGLALVDMYSNGFTHALTQIDDSQSG